MIYGKNNAEQRRELLAGEALGKERVKRLQEWHRVFLWRRKRLIDGRTAWLETVERRMSTHGYVHKDGPEWVNWQYRALDAEETDQ